MLKADVRSDCLRNTGTRLYSVTNAQTGEIMSSQKQHNNTSSFESATRTASSMAD